MTPLKNLLKNSINGENSILHREQRSIGWATFEMIILVFATKVLALFKMALIAGRFGASRELDLFYIANTIPELIFNVIAVGSINAALIPTFAQCLKKEGAQVAARFFRSIMIWAVAAFTIAALIMFFFAPQLVELYYHFDIGGAAASFTESETMLAAKMMRIMLVSPIFLGVSSVISAYLLLNKRFLMTRMAPLVYNVGTIIGVLVFVPLLDGSVKGLSYGIVFSSVLHLIIQVPTLLKVARFENIKEVSIPKGYFKRIGKLALPRILTVAAGQIGGVIRSAFAFNLTPGSLSAFQFARTLYPIAVDVFGTTTAEAIYPKLSALGAEGKREALALLLKKGFQQLLFLTLPVTVIMLVLRLPIVRFAYGLMGPAFKWEDSVMTSWVLLFLVFLIVSESIAAVVVRGFYALSDTVTPFIVSLIYLVLNLVLAYFLVIFFSNFNTYSLLQPYAALGAKTLASFLTSPGGSAVAIGGLALASAIARGIEVIVLTGILNKRVKFIDRGAVKAIAKKLFSSIVMGMALYSSFRLFDTVLDTAYVAQLFLVLACSTLIGVSVYLVAEYIVDDRDVFVVKALFSKFVSQRFGSHHNKSFPGNPSSSADPEVA